jgi:hypothetical protein
MSVVSLSPRTDTHAPLLEGVCVSVSVSVLGAGVSRRSSSELAALRPTPRPACLLTRPPLLAERLVGKPVYESPPPGLRAWRMGASLPSSDNSAA